MAVSTEACNLLRPLLFLVLLPAGASLSQAIPMKASAARKNNRGLYRVNQYRPRISHILAAQKHAALVIAPNLPNQPNVVEVHRPCATGCWAALGAETNGDGIYIRQVHARKCL